MTNRIIPAANYIFAEVLTVAGLDPVTNVPIPSSLTYDTLGDGANSILLAMLNADFHPDNMLTQVYTVTGENNVEHTVHVRITDDGRIYCLGDENAIVTLLESAPPRSS